jgi:hypothetical protein
MRVLVICMWRECGQGNRGVVDTVSIAQGAEWNRVWRETACKAYTMSLLGSYPSRYTLALSLL